MVSVRSPISCRWLCITVSSGQSLIICQHRNPLQQNTESHLLRSHFQSINAEIYVKFDGSKRYDWEREDIKLKVLWLPQSINRFYVQSVKLLIRKLKTIPSAGESRTSSKLQHPTNYYDFNINCKFFVATKSPRCRLRLWRFLWPLRDSEHRHLWPYLLPCRRRPILINPVDSGNKLDARWPLANLPDGDGHYSG